MYLLCATMVPWPKTRTGLKYNSQSQALKPKTSKKVVIGLVKFFSKRSVRHALEGLYLDTLEAKAKDQGHKRKCSPKKKKKGLHRNFSSDLHKKTFSKNFSSTPQNFNNSKNSAVLEPRTGRFSRTWGLEAKAKDLTFEQWRI